MVGDFFMTFFITFLALSGLENVFLIHVTFFLKTKMGFKLSFILVVFCPAECYIQLDMAY